MSAKAAPAAFDLPAALLAAFSTNNRINAYLISNLPEEAWHGKPPGGKGRTIAAIVAHMHNVRLMWLKAVDGAAPPKLEGDDFSQKDAVQSLEESCQALQRVLARSLAGDGRIRGFKPDAAGFLAYLLAHDAHHRGQITMLARQLGYPLPKSVGFGMWEWGTR